MTRSTLPPNFGVPEPTVSELDALYHEAAGAEPSAMLDRSILDAARTELQDRSATKSRRPAPWWKVWVTATSAIAAVVVGLSVTWRVMDEQERSLREEMNRAEGGREKTGESAGSATSAERPAEAKSTSNSQAPAAARSRRVESTAVQDIPVGVPDPVAKPVPAAPALAAPAAMVPVPAEEAVKKNDRAELDQLRGRRDASTATDSGSGPVRQMGKAEAGVSDISTSGEKTVGALAKPVASPSADSVGQAAIDTATPEAWLKHIRELRASGHRVEAAQSLARFRVRYPDFVLPADLFDLK